MSEVTIDHRVKFRIDRLKDVGTQGVTDNRWRVVAAGTASSLNASLLYLSRLTDEIQPTVQQSGVSIWDYFVESQEDLDGTMVASDVAIAES